MITSDDAIIAVAPIFDLLVSRWTEEYCELLDAFEFPDLLVKHGLATKEPYDPDKHGESFNEVEPGDDFYILTPLAQSIRACARETST